MLGPPASYIQWKRRGEELQVFSDAVSPITFPETKQLKHLNMNPWKYRRFGTWKPLFLGDMCFVSCWFFGDGFGGLKTNIYRTPPKNHLLTLSHQTGFSWEIHSNVPF